MGKGVKWTDEEVRVLKENYTIKSKDEILKMFPPIEHGKLLKTRQIH